MRIINKGCMYLMLSLFFVLLSITNSFAAVAPDTEWEKTLITSYTDLLSVAETGDGGYVTVTNKNNRSTLIKFDANGNVLWEKSYGVEYRNGAYVIRTSDGGFAFTGSKDIYVDGEGDLPYTSLIKTDASGNLQWEMVYEINEYPASGRIVHQTSDGGFIILNDISEIFKVNSTGSEEWKKWLGVATNFILPTNDGGYITVGSNGNVYLSKLDGSGNKVWERSFGGSDLDVGYSVDQTTDGGFIVIGETKSYGAGVQDVYLIKTDSSGNAQWTKTFGGQWSDTARFVEQTSDGGYIIAANLLNYSYLSLIKTDSTGNQSWEKQYSGAYGFFVHQTNDQGYIAAGFKNSSYHYGYLVKIKPEDFTPPIITITSPTGVTNDKTPSLSYSVNETSTVVVKVDGQVVSKVSGQDLDPLAVGSHSLRVEATDAAGNKGTKDVTFIVANTSSLAAGRLHTLALKSDGTVWAWGTNLSGQLGDGTTTGTFAPVQVFGLSGAAGVAAGQYHSLALKNDGKVWAWGRNNYGQLGDGSTVNKNTAVEVYGLTDVMAISAGKLHSLALKADGTVWAWGRNYYGQLGDGTTADKTVPVQVYGLTDVVAISAGQYHSIALKSDGTVWAWGNNYYGQLGIGTNQYRNVPTQALNLTGITGIAAGWAHSVALKDDGTIWTWGLNVDGQLGNGTNVSSLSPVQASITGAAAIASGASNLIAVKTDGTLWNWGYNNDWQLGDENADSKNIPTQISGLTGIAEIAGGWSQSIAMKTDNTFWAWGYNYFGQLGNGTNEDSFTPVQVILQ